MKFLIAFAAFIVAGKITKGKRDFFVCENESIIPMNQFCDGIAQCKDGSDEVMGNATNNSYVQCSNFHNNANRKCVVKRKLICSEEISCSDLTPCDLNCESHYRCQNRSLCFKRSTVCDGIRDNGCPEDDGKTVGVGFKCTRNQRDCILPQQLVLDDVSDCDGEVDRCVLPSLDLSNSTEIENAAVDDSRCFKCFNEAEIIQNTQVCDGIIDCTDLSDECMCEDNPPDICMSIYGFGVNSSSKNSTCLPGNVLCGNKTCIESQKVCNGIPECLNGLDEKHDYCQETLQCKYTTLFQHTGKCSCIGMDNKFTSAKVCNNVIECRSGKDEDCLYCSVALRATQESYPISCSVAVSQLCRSYSKLNNDSQIIASTNDSQIWLTAYTPERYTCDHFIHCDENRADEKFCPENFECDTGIARVISIPHSKVCDGIFNCADKTDEELSRCNETRFYCSALGGSKMSIDRGKICDYKIDCDDAEDEMNCTDGRFYCEDKKHPFFVRPGQVNNGRPSCVDWSDECPSNISWRNDNLFSSRYHLIGNPVLRTFVRIMGFASLLGNIAVLVTSAINISELRNKRGGILANRLLIMNLAMADLLMGIYLIALGSSDAATQGRFCSMELQWKSGVKCTVLGVLNVISTETSVLSMVVLTFLRLYAVYRPLKGMSRPRPIVVIILMLGCWAMSTFLALFPLADSLENTFVERIVIDESPLVDKASLKLEKYRKLIRDIKLFESISIGKTETFKNISMYSIEELNRLSLRELKHNHLIQVLGQLGYYSRPTHAVCLPKLFVSTRDSAWQFSFAVTLLNFTSFMFVLVSYLGIYYKTKQSQALVRGKESKDLSETQRKIFRILATDFCCWVPICVMSFITISGVRLSNEAYAFAAIILLPINSALNPILYSNIPDLLIQAGRRAINDIAAPSEPSTSTKTTSQIDSSKL